MSGLAEISHPRSSTWRRIRRHWPRTRLTWPSGQPGLAPGHGTVRDNGVDYIFGLAGNSVARSRLRGGRRPHGVPRRSRKRTGCGASPPSPTPPVPGAANAVSSPGWRRPRAGARTSSPRSAASPAISTKPCTAPASQAENLIKLHKGQLRLRPDLLRARSPTSRRLVLHTAAYWLMLALRDAVHPPDAARLGRYSPTLTPARLLKIGARVARKGRPHPHPPLRLSRRRTFRLLAGRLAASGP